MKSTAVLAFVSSMLTVQLSAQLLEISPDLKSLLPTEMVEFAESLTLEEREIARSVNDRNGTATYIAELRDKDRQLAARAADRIRAFQEKFNRLSGPAQKFIEAIIFEIDGRTEHAETPVLKKIATKVTDLWHKLPVDLKKEIEALFPHIPETLESKHFQYFTIRK